MPIYEYQCQSCGVRSEQIQKISEDPLTACEACGVDDSLKRLVSQTSFVLKGSGWYVTDYKGKKTPSPSEGSPESPSSKDSGGSSSSEGKASDSSGTSD
jgi:putative FmdB family regulatory protein